MRQRNLTDDGSFQERRKKIFEACARDRLRHKNKYTSDSLGRIIAPFKDRLLKSTKNFSVKTKLKHTRTFLFQLLFQAVTEAYSNHRVANNNAHAILVPLNFLVSA